MPVSTMDVPASLDVATSIDSLIVSGDPEVRRDGTAVWQIRDSGGAAGSFRWVVDTTNQRIGFSEIDGSFAPAEDLHFEAQTPTVPTWLIDFYGANAENFCFTGRKSEGTKAAPTALTIDSDMWEFAAVGYDGTAFSGMSAVILFEAAENWAVGAHGTQQIFKTTPNLTTTLTEVMVLSNDQTVIVTGGTNGLTGPVSDERLRVEGAIRATQAVATSGTPDAELLVIGAAHTTLTAAEATDVHFDLDRTVEFTAGGVIADQRAVRIDAPTYAATAAQTITAACTLAITGAPVAGANMTLTNTYALCVTGGIQADRVVYQRHLLYADQLDNPVTADWAVNALAPAAADSNNSGLTVRLFDDTTEEGVGFIFTIPEGATNLTITFKSRAETTPGGAVAVVPTLYARTIGDNSAVGAWSAGTDLTALDFTTNEFFQYDTQTITLASESLTAGDCVQFEITRNTGSGSDTLVGDWALLEIGVVFS